MPLLLHLIQHQAGFIVLTQMGMGQALQQQGLEVTAFQVVALGGERQNVKLLLIHKGAQVLQHDALLSKGQPMGEASPAKAPGMFDATDFSFAAPDIRRLLHLHPACDSHRPLSFRHIAPV
jgi:hypothetical protein